MMIIRDISLDITYIEFVIFLGIKLFWKSFNVRNIDKILNEDHKDKNVKIIHHEL